MAGWIYFMSDRPHGAIYIGVTSNILRRVTEHRSGTVGGFTLRYGLRRLVYVERHATIVLAIQREKTLKHWRRAWKVRLIHQGNPNWDDLYDGLLS
jgi:putative endonuclease